jgi:putative transposase
MPRRNTVKIYLKNGIYHIYNRGVEKRKIFLDEQDYRVFLRFLKEALSSPLKPLKQTFTTSLQGSTFKGVPRQPKNFFKKIELYAYCLMPNHFHLLLKQNEVKSMKDFMQSIATRYSLYFNKKYKRVGSLFQGIYKAVLVMEEPYLLHLSRYIHRNPLEFHPNLLEAFSSYADYLGKRQTGWLNTTIILSSFGSSLTKTLSIRSYQDFVEKWKGNSEETLQRLVLETP